MLMFDRRLVSHFDFGLLALVFLIMGAGVATILSATYVPGHVFSAFTVRQLAWILVGLIAMMALLTFDYRLLERYAYAIYAAALALLLLVPLAGSVGGGSRRWINLGPASVQPSEFMKVALVIALARCLHPRVTEGTLPIGMAIAPILIAGVPAALILLQPDLGTALLLGFLLVTVLLTAGLRARWLAVAVAVVGPILPLAWSHLKPYQQRRLLTFVDPQADPLGAGYHVIQSQIAIGSGGLAGKGYLGGTQNHLNFLPEQHTDFIFSVFAEEWGLIGAAVLLGLYAILVARCLVGATHAKDSFGMLLAFGVATLIAWQVIINVGMASGILPVVGITLPLFSYGGSSLLVILAGIGLIMNVNMRRFTF